MDGWLGALVAVQNPPAHACSHALPLPLSLAGLQILMQDTPTSSADEADLHKRPVLKSPL